MFGTYQIARFFKIPLKVHFSLIIVLPFLASQISSLGYPFILSLCLVSLFFLSVAAHEYGHAWVALKCGHGVRQIILFPFGGVAQIEGLLPKPKHEFWIAIAGPLVSLALALLFFVPVLIYGESILKNEVGAAFPVLAAANLGLFLFNMLPSFPMDGGRIFRACLTPRIGRIKATLIASKLGQFMAILFGFYALYNLQIMLIIIAVFIYYAAGAECRMVMAHEQIKRQQEEQFAFWIRKNQQNQTPPPRVYGDDEVIVGPPPYEK